MKLEINLEDQYGWDDACVAEIIRNAIKYEIHAHAKKIAKEELKKYEAKIKKDIAEALANIKSPKLKDLIKND